MPDDEDDGLDLARRVAPGYNVARTRSARTAGEYRPEPESRRILELAMAAIRSVNYKVPARWVFYRLHQAGALGSMGKEAYHKRFLPLLSKARKAFYGQWRPDTLTDDTREISILDGGYTTPGDWFQSFLKSQCVLTVRAKQPVVLMVLFEAAAMASQFEHYLAPLRVTYAPFRGDSSIPHKWAIAKQLEKLHRAYPGKPVTVLYFGDYDPKGLSIPLAALKDIWNWIENDPKWGRTLHRKQTGEWDEFSTPNGGFRWIRVGINASQVERLNIEENPEKPGTYQWEALEDEQAANLILPAVKEFWSEQVVRDALALETKAEKKWYAAIAPVVQKLVKLFSKLSKEWSSH